MGKKNASLIRAAEHFRKTVGTDHDAFKIAEKAVDDSQAACPHSGEIKTFTAPSDSVRGKWKKGDVVEYCTDCSKPMYVIIDVEVSQVPPDFANEVAKLHDTEVLAAFTEMAKPVYSSDSKSLAGKLNAKLNGWMTLSTPNPVPFPIPTAFPYEGVKFEDYPETTYYTHWNHEYPSPVQIGPWVPVEPPESPDADPDPSKPADTKEKP